jgi:sec-independent protein translocase protein TatC
MATAVRSVGHDDRLSLVEHLDELRTRLIICVAALAVCFAVCAWQNGRILEIINVPLEQTAFKKDTKGGRSSDPFEQTAAFQQQVKRTSLAQAQAFLGFAAAARTAADAERWRAAAEAQQRLAASVPPLQAKRPVTLGVGEPFTQTIRLAGYAALLLALPLILYQIYAFILPAFSPREKQVALPLMAAVPFLFVAGVVFAYYAVLPSAVDFLQNFNDDQYDILIQARDYYKFSISVLIAMGLAFQVPIGMIAVTRVGIISVAQLRKNRRYAIIIIAIAAMILPGQDPVTMLMIMLPMFLLYEGSILMAALLDRRSERAAAREAAESAAANDSELLPLDSDED